MLNLPDYQVVKEEGDYEDVQAYQLIGYVLFVMAANVPLNFYALVNVYNVNFEEYLVYILNGHKLLFKLPEASIFIKGKFVFRSDGNESSHSSLATEDLKEFDL